MNIYTLLHQNPMWCYIITYTKIIYVDCDMYMVIVYDWLIEYTINIILLISGIFMID